MSVRAIPDFLKRDPLELGYRVSEGRMLRKYMGMPEEERVPDFLPKLAEKR